MTQRLVIVLLCAVAALSAADAPNLADESQRTLTDLVRALRRLQIDEAESPDAGAIRCPACNVLHTRAAEAVFPFSVLAARTEDAEYADAARRLAAWLFRQQQPDGSWKETPEEWTGTTTDQLLMIALAYERLGGRLDAGERVLWTSAMRAAADYLTATMDPSFASINYCATTAAALATMNRLMPDARWAVKARTLAWQVAAAMDEDGFIGAEGERAFDHKYGADVGYEMDMSLWGLALYATITGDSAIRERVVHAVRTHLAFVYPQGAIDGSWGIRSNKWTTFGSQTADGSQILFALTARDEPRGLTAAARNLAYLRTMMRDGLVGYGPDFWGLADAGILKGLSGAPVPCIYPTFARAKNLALTVEQDVPATLVAGPLPADEPSWMRLFPTVDVAVVRTARVMGTVSAYRYKDIGKRDRSKYMHRPTGGALSSLWMEGYGFVQVGSQTAYERWEPMHFPEAPGIRSLTPRIEMTTPRGYFTNLYDFNAGLVTNDRLPVEATVTARGELSNRSMLPGGVGYTLAHTFRPDGVEKRIHLRYRGDARDVRVVEPIVRQAGVRFEREGQRAVRISAPGRTLLFELLDGDAELEGGVDESLYWAPFPAIRAFPIVLRVRRSPGQIDQVITTRIRSVDGGSGGGTRAASRSWR